MRRKLFSAVLMLVLFATSAMAKVNEQVEYKSATGVIVAVPEECEVLNDDDEALVIQTPDKLFTFVANPFDIEETSEEEIASMIIEMEETAEITDPEYTEIDNDFVRGFMLVDINDGVSHSACGYLVLKGNGKAFIVTVIGGGLYTDAAWFSYVTMRAAE